MNCARLAGGSTLIGGQKSVETVAAYLLLSLWPVPARKWEEDRGWVYLGLAIRYAVHLCYTVTIPNPTMMPQDRDGYQPAPPAYGQATERTTCSRDSEPNTRVAELLQHGPLVRVAVWEGADYWE